MRRCFEAWLAKRGHSGNGERLAMLSQVKAFLETNGDALFTEMHRMHEDKRAHTPLRVGFRRVVDESGVSIKFDSAQEYIEKVSVRTPILWQYLCLPERFRREMCKGHDADAVAKLLRERGHLMTEGDRLMVRQRVNGLGKPSVYLIKPSIFEDEFEDL